MRFLNAIFDLLFPARCIACGATETDFCIDCLGNCPYAERETAQWIFSVFDYRHPPVKKALWLFKYKGKKKFANIFAEVLYGKIAEELSDLSAMENFNNAILIPIPLSSKRLRERGYNQTELVCNILVELDKSINFRLEKNILIKPEETEHQARIENRRERLKNIIGSFAVKNPEQNKEFMQGKNIILIDDITTTGATLSEARKILKQAGARKVIAFTVAH